MLRSTLFTIFLFPLVTLEADTFFVDILATGTADGQSWKDAFPDLQQALLLAGDGDEVFVAKGTYQPTGTTDRDISFVVKPAVRVYGGFDTGGGSSGVRSPESFLTILSGEIGSLGVIEDNSRNVIRLQGGSSDTLLDGFTITRSYGRDRSPSGFDLDGSPLFTDVGTDGGGLLVDGNGGTVSGSDAVIRNCRIVENVAQRGGGVFANNARFEECEINSNVAHEGAGIRGSYLELYRCEVRGNLAARNEIVQASITGDPFQTYRAASGGGGWIRGLYAESCLFAGNEAVGSAGGLRALRGPEPLTLINCTFSGNGGGSRPRDPDVAQGQNLGDLESGCEILYVTDNDDPGQVVLISTVIWPAPNSTSSSISFSPERSLNVIGTSSSAISDPVLSFEDDFDIRNSVVRDTFYRLPNGRDDLREPSFFDIGFRDPVTAQLNAPRADGDFRLTLNSSLVNTGYTGLDVSPGSIDLDGELRVRGLLDIGAYEFPVKYVDGDATGSGNGTSWENAYTRLDTALQSSGEGDVYWLADGVYTPTSTADRSRSFIINEGVSLYGGFDGVSHFFADRSFRANETILSGDIGVSGQSFDNSFHVINASSSDSNSLLNGLSIRDGMADGSGADQDRGGGLYSTAVENLNIEHCIFSGNGASGDGGAVFLENATKPRFERVLFSGNRALNRGSALFLKESSPTLVNLTIAGNLSGPLGGAVHIETEGGPPLFRNTVIWNNQSGGNVGSSLSSLSFSPGSNLASYVGCLIEGVTLPQASGLLGKDPANDPLFFNPVAPSMAPTHDGDYRINLGSPLTDQALASVTTLTTDLYERPPARRGMDIGIYEANLIHYCKFDATGAETGRDWENAFPDLSRLMASPFYRIEVEGELELISPREGDEVRVAGGTYHPSGSPSGGPLTEPFERNASFFIRPGVRHLGGFKGEDEDLSDRDLEQNETILSGEILTNVEEDNVYHVIDTRRATIMGPDTLLDGFTIQDGRSNLGTFRARGGGMFIGDGHAPTIRNCYFRNNQAAEFGGAVFLGTSSGAFFEDCRFTDNQSDGSGGAVGAFAHLSISMKDCVFDSNVANFGGAIDLSLGENLFENCLFRGNHIAQDAGFPGEAVRVTESEQTEVIGCSFIGNGLSVSEGSGILYLSETTASIVNCTFAGNRVRGGPVWLDGNQSFTEMSNTIIWGNESLAFSSDGGVDDNAAVVFGTVPGFVPADQITYSHCLLQNANPVGVGNLDGSLAANDPQFVMPLLATSSPTTAGDYTLSASSPARDIGLDSANMQSFDLLGNARKFGTIDLGAFEYSPSVGLGSLDDDDDLDGVPNGVELAIGTSPTFPDLLDPAHLQFDDGSVRFGVDLAEQGNLIIELVRSEDMMSFPVVVATNATTDFVVDGQGLLFVSDPNPPVGGRAFYRLQVSFR